MAVAHNSATLGRRLVAIVQNCEWKSPSLVFLSCGVNRWKSKHSIHPAHLSKGTDHISYMHSKERESVPENADSIGDCSPVNRVINRRKLIGFFNDNPPRRTATGRFLFCLR